MQLVSSSFWKQHFKQSNLLASSIMGARAILDPCPRTFLLKRNLKKKDTLVPAKNESALPWAGLGIFVYFFPLEYECQNPSEIAGINWKSGANGQTHEATILPMSSRLFFLIFCSHRLDCKYNPSKENPQTEKHVFFGGEGGGRKRTKNKTSRNNTNNWSKLFPSTGKMSMIMSWNLELHLHAPM